MISPRNLGVAFLIMVLTLSLVSCILLEALLGKSNEAADARRALAQETPSATLVKKALSDYGYAPGGCNSTEAREMIAWMGASYFGSNGQGDITGKLGSDYYITIWNDTYDKVGVYGFRYGIDYPAYWSSNATYFEIRKP